MPFDTLIKKFFPGIVAALVAVIAYFQASGVVQLATSSALAPDPEEMASGSLQRTGAPPNSSTRTRTANKLFEHNVFDPDTELQRTLPEPEPEPSEEGEKSGPGRLDLSDPLGADTCDGVLVNIVTESDDPTWSIAVLQAPGEERPSLRRVGDKAGDFEVAYIGFNRVEASPAVWLIKGSDLCQALLFAEEKAKPSKGSKPEPKKPEPEQKPEGTKPQRGAPTVPKEIAEKIEKVSATEFNVDRAVVDNILENQAQLMRSARIVPEKGADGKTVGIRLFGIRPDTLLGSLGLQNGDRIETINGFNMANPEDALNAYARLRTANKLSVKLTRRGKPTTVDLNIK